jgi:hypothetical protein
MNFKAFGRTEEDNQKHSGSVPAEIQTEHLSNTTLQRYR